MDLNVVFRRSNCTVLLLALLSVFTLLGVSNAAALQSVTLVWSPSPDANVTGYNVYYGVASRTYTNRVDAGSATNAVIAGLKEGVTYYFAATAYNILGIESEYSAEVSYTVPGTTGNAAPTLNVISSVTIPEDAGMQTINLSGISSGSSAEAQTLTVTATSSHTGIVPHPTVTYASPNTTGTLKFTPLANQTGSATVTVVVNDGAATNNTVTRTFLVTVASVNDVPTLNTLGNVSVNEDSGLRTINLSGISSGAPNEVQTLTVTASSSSTGVVPNPTVAYTSPNATGAISFTPVPDAFGTATVTVTVKDGGASNNAVVRTFSVAVNPVNDAPTLNAITSLSLPQNASQQTVSLSGIGSGAANETQTLAVTASSSNPGLIPNPAVTYTSPAATGTLVFTPVAGVSGSAIVTVTVNDGGSSNNVLSRTFSVSVNTANQAPTLNSIGNLSIAENSGPKTVNLGGITSGSTNEAQVLTVTATSSNPALIPTPTINYTSPNTTGTLVLTPATNAFGSSTITVTVKDNGATNNVVTRSFTVTVNSVNSVPTLNPLPNLTLSRNAGVQTVNLSGITSGAANESQTLSVSATTSDTSVIPTVTVNYSSPASTGQITFTPAFLATGSSIITVKVNDGGTSNNIVSRSFTVTITAPPTISAIPNQTIGVNSNTGPVSFTLADSDTPASTLTLSATSSAAALIPTNNIVFGGTDAVRTVKLTPLAGKTGSATITLFVSDGTATASTTFQLNVLGAPAAPQILTIITEGEGTVSGASSGQALTAGKTYTLTAVPAPGQEFAGWSGGLKSSSPKITFTATTSMVVQATFVPSPYRIGSYSGLIFEEEQIRLATSGMFSLLVTKQGTYSARLQVGTAKYTATGKFGLDCQATNTIVRVGRSPLVLRMTLGNGELADRVYGELTDGTWVANLQGDRSVFGKTNAAPFAGNYTLVIPGSDDGASVPAGHGFGTVKVSTLGKALFSGVLADGSKITQSATLAKSGAWPFYASINKGQGAAISWLTFTNRSSDDISGAMSWIKSPSALSKFYPGGFDVESEVIGSRFVSSTANLLTFSSGRVEFEGGNLPGEFSNLIQIGVKNSVSNLSTNALSLTFTSAKGAFKGKVTVPGTLSSYSFSGVVLQKANRGYGHAIGASQTSSVEIKD